jgi:hypothetical protein
MTSDHWVPAKPKCWQQTPGEQVEGKLLSSKAMQFVGDSLLRDLEC